MKTTPKLILFMAAGFLVALAIGCSPTKPIYLKDNGSLSYYLEQATDVEYPDIDIPSLDEVTQAQSPMTVIDPEFTAFEDVTLEDVVSMALLNTKVVRGYGTPGLLGTRVNPGQDNLTTNINGAQTTYNIAIRESEPGFIAQPGGISSPSSVVSNTALDSNQGVEAALADFDAQYTSSLNLATNDEPRNGTSILNAEVFTQTQFTWQNEIAKKSANGTQLFFRNISQYTENNNPLVGQGGVQELDSFYRTSLEAELRQPLLRGRGAFINRMPIVISRISADQEIANLEATLQNMVTNLEIRYWDLYRSYRALEAAQNGRDAALETYRLVKKNFDVGIGNTNVQNLSQAADQYYLFDRQVIEAYNDLLNAEGQLRFLLGWSATDGRFLRPIDEPVTAPVEFDWLTTLGEALTYRPEIRQTRWEIKKRELALQYSKNGLLPELNLSVVYRWLGLGNKFGTADGSPQFPDPNSAALNELYGGNFQELAVGGTFAMPVGFRREQANVRNAELKLAREIARGEDLELDVTKELSEAIRALAANQMIMRTAFNRWVETTREIEHWKRTLGTTESNENTLNVALGSQRRRSEAEISFHAAVVEYNKTIALIHRRKGTTLAYSGIEFSEGPWPGKAYIDAEEHARRRTASRQLNYGWTRPQVISRGANLPTAGNTGQPTAGTVLPETPETPAMGGTMMEETLDGGSYIQMPDGTWMEESMQGQPYYEMQEAAPIQTTVPGEPTLASPRSFEGASHGTVPTSSATIRQVGYQQPADMSAGTVPVAVRSESGSPRTAAGNAATILARQPLRDSGNPSAKRLRASTDATVSEGAGQATSAPSANNTQPILKTSEMDWEKMGLSRPSSSAGKTTARIKTQQ